MIKLFAAAAVAALVAACAAPPPPGAAGDPLRQGRGSTPAGEAKAADLGFHGPLHRVKPADGPN